MQISSTSFNFQEDNKYVDIDDTSNENKGLNIRKRKSKKKKDEKDDNQEEKENEEEEKEEKEKKEKKRIKVD